MLKTIAGSVGGLAAGLLGSLCCTGPLIFATFGVGAGLASTFEPVRPLFGIVMVGLFGLGYHTVYGEKAAPPGVADGSGEACTVRRSRRREKTILWTAAAAALVFWSFPVWSRWLI